MLPVGVLGTIVAGAESGRFVEIIDDREVTGGFLVLTHADVPRPGPSYDMWFSSMDDLAVGLDEAGWRIEWHHPTDRPATLR